VSKKFRGDFMNKIVDGLMICLVVYFFWYADKFNVFNIKGDVGPAFFPRLMAICLFILVVSDLYLNIRTDKKIYNNGELSNGLEKLKKSLASLGIPRNTTIIIVLTIIYLLLLPWAGFALTTIGYTVLLMFIYGVRSKKYLILAGVFGVLIIHLIFSKLLLVPLP